MGNKEQHLSIALIVLIFLFFILKYFNILQYFPYGITLFFGAIAPDFLEPAKNYKHRSYFHSKRFLKVLFYSLLISLVISFFVNYILYIFFFILGYITHLGIDATTKMGLPK